ncbi:MAG: twin-arginine translocase TatA/TatE family subunit [Bacteroidales bacterium]|jgi:Tat protein translocase TatB subunit|nr:twin-arginine translocase TatA/TatE family subunit [Bacteroidales bacterium]
MSFGEILLIAVVVLLLFGPKGLTDGMRTVGKWMYEFRKAADDIKRELNNGAIGDVKQEIREVTDNVRKKMEEYGREVEKEAENQTDTIIKEVDQVKDAMHETATGITKETEDITKEVDGLATSGDDVAATSDPEYNYRNDYSNDSGT